MAPAFCGLQYCIVSLISAPRTSPFHDCEEIQGIEQTDGGGVMAANNIFIIILTMEAQLCPSAEERADSLSERESASKLRLYDFVYRATRSWAVMARTAGCVKRCHRIFLLTLRHTHCWGRYCVCVCEKDDNSDLNLNSSPFVNLVGQHAVKAFHAYVCVCLSACARMRKWIVDNA